MKHATKIAAVAMLACVAVWALVQAADAPDSLVERYPSVLREDHRPQILYFGATWCSPCKTQKPKVLALKAEGYRVRTFDYDDHTELAKWFHVSSVPKTILWKDQTIQKFWVGVAEIKPQLTAEYKIKAVIDEKDQQNAEALVPQESNRTCPPGKTGSG